jgi:hypothetical protein
MHGTPTVEPLIFKTHILLAADALRVLGAGFHTLDEELALRVAIYAREAILASYRAWEQLGEPAYGRQALAELRHHGHHVLRDYLAYANEHVIGFAADTTLDEKALEVALVAILWKVSSALDREDEADPA